MSRAAEAFQLDGRKDNVLLQIEKALLLTWSVSDLVTVRTACSYRSGCVLLQVTYI
jgi:hypothetical protein